MLFRSSQTANSFPSSKVYVAALGVYNLQFSLQLENTDSQLQDVNIWLGKNGSPESNSNTLVSVPNKHGSVNGHGVAAWNFYLEYTALTDYFELYWLTDDTNVQIKHEAGFGTAPNDVPEIPSIILTVTFVSALFT